ncbi:MAG: phytoene synthase [Parvicellaceae bacterium]|jgi:phytoene synthase
MKQLFDQTSFECSQRFTSTYSTSFSHAVKMLAPSMRPAIHSIYGFVRLADEIVDSFHDWDKRVLLDNFELEFHEALNMGLSLNPILNSFQLTVKKYNLDLDLVDAFFKSMRMDLDKKIYETEEEYKEYIYGSADVVGLMCLKIFVEGDEKKYEELKVPAMNLGSAFQKVNFLRDLKDDVELLERSYFPNIDLKNLDAKNKELIIQEIEDDFAKALKGIEGLPKSSKFGVYTAYMYYSRLLKKLKKTPSEEIISTRVRVNNVSKMGLLAKSYVNLKFNLL